ncbi:hypothetical protein [Shewanella saliphila]|uniref:Methyltransferase FkbM domain-containing protein n=1 Tax=Shewanella saliphila TaxID=2282698 RepID=A0ABQ2Q6L7_9GAMM|nr:hypothetical protein [Shewanella saliphila]MCL1101356.1 hypothetical protein [Shewanella saliphila]GGP50348.1 hypothetical protein GCM10009409_16060 [Shewanella saliphila]
MANKDLNDTADNKVVSNKVDYVFHLGAGVGVDIIKYQALQSKQIFLYEGNPDTFTFLSNEYKSLADVTIYSDVISPQKESAKFLITSPAQFSSLGSVEYFRKKFKNLKVQEKKKVMRFGLSELIKRHSDAFKSSTVVLDLKLNGIEFDLLNNASADELLLFKNINIQALKDCTSVDYEKSKNDTISSLLKLGFVLDSINFDSVFVNYEFKFLQEQSALSNLSNSIEAIVVNNGSLQEELNTAQQALAQQITKSEQYEQTIKQEFLTLTEEISSLNDDKQRLSDIVLELETNSRQLTAIKLKLETDKKQQSEKAAADTAALTTKVSELEANNKQLIETKTKLETDKKKQSEQAAADTAALTTKVSELEANNKQLIETKTKLEADKKQQSEKVASDTAALTTKVSKLEERNKQLIEIKTKLETDAKKQREHATENIAELNEKIIQLENAIKQLEIDRKQVELDSKNQIEKNEVNIAQLKNKIEQLQSDNQALVEKNNAEVNALKLKVTALELTNQALEKSLHINDKALDSLVEKITASQSKELDNLKNRLAWHIQKQAENSTKQIESFIGVQSFLESGSLTMEYHGWPISSDIALFLLGKIKSNNYDLIIEFGSGTSTRLFAQAMQHDIIGTQPHIEDLAPKRIGKDTRKNEIELVDYLQDLPQRVLTFEHNKKYYDKTLASLQQNGLDNIVNLVHAPLVDCKINNDDYLYYSCDNALKHIADLFEGRTAKILVLIDGPPGATGPLARLPAVTKLLNHLGSHQMDLVLDDYNREEEKTIAERWKETIKARFIDIEEEIVPCEKGAWFCRVNP